MTGLGLHVRLPIRASWRVQAHVPCIAFDPREADACVQPRCGPPKGSTYALSPPVTLPDVGESRPVVLLAEDEAIIGFELADSLALEGFEIAGPFDTCASAEAWLKAVGHVDGAILDSALKDGPCTALARDLASRDIPFMFYSGHIRSCETPCEFSDAPWIVKPVPFEALLNSLRAVMVDAGRYPATLKPLLPGDIDCETERKIHFRLGSGGGWRDQGHAERKKQDGSRQTPREHHDPALKGSSPPMVRRPECAPPWRESIN
jgi:DNA-binding response OmpR family regulator